MKSGVIQVSSTMQTCTSLLPFFEIRTSTRGLNEQVSFRKIDYKITNLRPGGRCHSIDKGLRTLSGKSSSENVGKYSTSYNFIRRITGIKTDLECCLIIISFFVYFSGHFFSELPGLRFLSSVLPCVL